jgi:uncharacterized repeat protein (TIGR04138 family)
MPRPDHPESSPEQKRLLEILKKIVAYQRTLPEDRAVQIDELENRGLLSEADVDFMRSNSVTYEPGSVTPNEKGIGLSMRLGSVVGVSFHSITTRSSGAEDKRITFVCRCIDIARARRMTSDDHVNASELLSVAADVARELYGKEAPEVLRSMGVHSSATLGQLIFKLIDEGLASKRGKDRLEDFNDTTLFDKLFQ